MVRNWSIDFGQDEERRRSRDFYGNPGPYRPYHPRGPDRRREVRRRPAGRGGRAAGRRRWPWHRHEVCRNRPDHPPSWCSTKPNSSETFFLFQKFYGRRDRMLFVLLHNSGATGLRNPPSAEGRYSIHDAPSPRQWPLWHDGRSRNNRLAGFSRQFRHF